MRRVAQAALLVALAATAWAQEGLVAYWSFDEGQGTTVADASPAKLRGTITGAQWVNGRSGKALKFDGKSFVEVAASDAYQFTGSFTVALWERHMASERWMTALSTQTGSEFGWGLDLNAGASYGLTLIGLTDGMVMAENSTSPDGIWRHVAIVYDSVASKAAIYVNGVKAVERAVQGAPKKGSLPLRIGVYPGGMEQWFIGELDEIKLFGRALSADEIKALAK